MQVADQILLLFPSWSGPGPHRVLCKKGKPQEPAKFIPHSPLEEQEKDKLGPFIWAEHSYGHFDAAPRDQDLSFDAFLGDGASGRIHLELSTLKDCCALPASSSVGSHILAFLSPLQWHLAWRKPLGASLGLFSHLSY